MSYNHSERLSRRSSTKTTKPKVRESASVSESHFRSSPMSLSAADILYLQRMIGNHSVTSLMKSIHTAPKSVQRVAYNRNDGSCIFSDVAESPNKIVMTGKLRRDAQNVDDINANLDYHEAAVPLSKVDDKSMFGSFRTENVIEITVVQSQPQGKRIGYVLAYHLGLIAQKQGIKYIIAKNVTAAREPFYAPLGFRDALDEPRWADLVDEKDEIETTIRQNPDVPNIDKLLARKQAIVTLMEKNMIFISTADMIQNAQDKMTGHWLRG